MGQDEWVRFEFDGRDRIKGRDEKKKAVKKYNGRNDYFSDS